MVAEVFAGISALKTAFDIAKDLRISMTPPVATRRL